MPIKTFSSTPYRRTDTRFTPFPLTLTRVRVCTVYAYPLLQNLSSSGKAITAHILLPITTEVISEERDGPSLNLLIIVTTSI